MPLHLLALLLGSNFEKTLRHLRTENVRFCPPVTRFQSKAIAQEQLLQVTLKQDPVAPEIL